ncbi:MAG TPA: VWA domain-containing protein [Pyrinomonadaceae bacterium]|nr:VWA domain-containing protein [Pyrinomonadaceae bacterium]
MLLRRPLLLALCLATAAPSSLLATAPPAARAQTSQTQAGGQRLNLPASGEVRVENYRGGVELEVWGEEYVAVSAAGGEGAAETPAPARGRRRAASRRRAPARPKSPVEIVRSERLLSVVVARAAQATAARVDLKVSLPASARVQVFTSDGAVFARGLPVTLSAQTVSGDIRLDLDPSASADLTAHSLNGTVIFSDSQNSARPREVVRSKFQTRLGAGERAARLFSGRGRIQIGFRDESADDGAAPREEARRPRPLGDELTGDLPRAARTPQPTPEATPEEVDEDDVVRVESDLVTVNFSVVNRETNRGVTGLRREDFRLYEDGVEQQVEHFEASDAPFDLMLLVDLSGSTGKVTDLIRAAALRFVNATRPQDRVAVLAFAGDVRVVSPLTSDRERLRAAVSAMEPPQGHTRLYDAVNSAMEFYEREAAASRRRAVILMSDGLDSTMPNVTGVGSTLEFDEVRRRVEEFDGVVYTIWTSTEYEAFSPKDIQPETFDLAHDRMAAFAEAGGGVFYDVERLEDLAGAYERVIEDLGTLYSLSYRPTNRERDSRWRAIRIRLPRHPGAIARGKSRYRAS